MNGKKYNIVAIGAGPGGLQCASHAASRGARCALIDKIDVGGECLRCGCIPTKSMVHSLDIYRLAKNASTMGIDIRGDISCNFSAIMAREELVVEGHINQIHKGLAALKVDYFNGTGSIINPNTVRIRLSQSQTEQKKEVFIEADNIVIGTGSSPNRLTIPGAHLPGVLTNREIFNLKSLPQSMIVVGCGYVGVEMAAIFAAMGSRVEMLEKEEFLMGFDRRISQTIQRHIEQRQGVNVEVGVDIFEIKQTDTGPLKVLYEKDGQERSTQGEIILLATGRTPNTEDLFDGDIKIAQHGSAITVNKSLETNIQGIYAVGDVLNGAMTAFTAATEGEVVADNCLGKSASVDYTCIPRCVFTHPPYACVGITEKETNSMDELEYGIAEYPFSTIVMAEISNEIEGFTRLIYEKGSGKILGGHILGPQSFELIAELTLAVHQGVSVRELASVLHFHPSLSEGLQRAARVGWLSEDKRGI